MGTGRAGARMGWEIRIGVIAVYEAAKSLRPRVEVHLWI
jgi:hypothetical protein